MPEEFVKCLPDNAYKKYRTVSLSGVPGETTLYVSCVA